jgi:hypothetical protein
VFVLCGYGVGFRVDIVIVCHGVTLGVSVRWTKKVYGRDLNRWWGNGDAGV